MILTKAFLQLPIFYLDPLLVVVAFTFAEATSLGDAFSDSMPQENF
jgi:hypothetical protein